MNRFDEIYFRIRARLSILIVKLMEWIEENAGIK